MLRFASLPKSHFFAVAVLFVATTWLCVTEAVSVEAPESSSQASGSGTCIHDALMQAYGVSLRTLAPQSYETGDRAAPLTTSWEAVASAGQRTLLQTTGSVQPIRIRIDTRFLLGDGDRSCYAAGQRYRVGSPAGSSSPTCDSSTQTDCWGTCTAADVLTQDKVDVIVNRIMPAARSFFQTALSVRPVQGPLRLTSGSCGVFGGVRIPDEYVDPGASDTDTVLFVTARPTQGSVVGFAVQCQEDRNFRPVAGQLNLSPSLLFQVGLGNEVHTAIHEMMHVLGFSANKFSELVDENGNRRPRSQVLQQTARTGARDTPYTVTNVITPSVVSFVRQHFGCPSLAGAPLEDGGGAGTAGSHWEKRVFKPDLMTGVLDPVGLVISPLTLAFLADSGWYAVNYSAAQPMSFGYGRGCEFVQGSCACAVAGAASANCAWPADSYACSQPNARTCNFDRTSKALCSIGSYSQPLPPQFQYFSDPTVGGPSSAADFCPIPSPQAASMCADTSLNDPSGTAGETFGPGSRCFMSTLSRVGSRPGAVPACYPVTCTNDTVQVGIGGQLVRCPVAGGPVTVPGYSGSVVCPAWRDLCAQSALVVPPACPLGNCYPGHPVPLSAPVLGGILIGVVVFMVIVIGLCCLGCVRLVQNRRAAAAQRAAARPTPLAPPLATIPAVYAIPMSPQNPSPVYAPGTYNPFLAQQTVPYGQPLPPGAVVPGPTAPPTQP